MVGACALGGHLWGVEGGDGAGGDGVGGLEEGGVEFGEGRCGVMLGSGFQLRRRGFLEGVLDSLGGEVGDGFLLLARRDGDGRHVGVAGAAVG